MFKSKKDGIGEKFKGKSCMHEFKMREEIIFSALLTMEFFIDRVVKIIKYKKIVFL